MGLNTRIFNRFGKTKNQRIEKLAKKLIAEMEPFYSKEQGVNYIYILYDYDHINKREIHIKCNHGEFELKIETNEPNKNFKG